MERNDANLSILTNVCTAVSVSRFATSETSFVLMFADSARIVVSFFPEFITVPTSIFAGCATGSVSAGCATGSVSASCSAGNEVLKEEERKFDDALRNQVKIQITQRKNDFKGLEEAILQKEKQIAALQKEIQANKAKLKASNKELDNAKSKINRTKAEFDLSYQSVTNQIKEDLEKMNRYLK